MRTKHPALHKSATQDGVTYYFSRRVSSQRAFNEFMAAKAKGLPNGSKIRID